MKLNSRVIAGLSILGAMAVILVIPALSFPIIPTAPFLKYDAADIPIMIGTFLFGPLEGLLLTVIVSLIQGFFFAQDAFYGALMHIIATGTFALIGGFIYKYNRTIKGAIIGLIFGAVSSVIIMIAANLIVTPLYLGMPRAVVKGMLLPAIIPFNLIKFGVNSILCFLLYKRMHKVLDFITKGLDNKDKQSE